MDFCSSSVVVVVVVTVQSVDHLTMDESGSSSVTDTVIVCIVCLLECCLQIVSFKWFLGLVSKVSFTLFPLMLTLTLLPVLR